MLDRKQIKLDVRAFLKGRWWPAFLAAFLVFLAIEAPYGILYVTLPVLSLFVVFALSPLYMSYFGYFLKLARGENPKLGDAFDCFSNRYLPYLATYLWTSLWTLLWALLLYVPGIIKAIAYSFSPYIISENPSLGARKALKLSIAITDGHKGELFVLGLSFILWFLSCYVIVPMIYVIPYYATTHAVYYEKLKQQAIAEGKINPADFYAA